ncbi:MAG: aldo/keto reductase [Megasphaera sp.]|jgi:aryl-alcohol dehydrogenase-like predicted oxidoreductase|nr:aldo/keto reductase [Megasphaera sp.]MCH4217666.1 aldo/keto reductase [Megasphaera sp.]
MKQPVLDILNKYATEKQATKAQISLAWMLQKYAHVVPIPGSKNKERILENLGASKVTLSDKEGKELETALNACEIHGHRGSVESQQTSFGNHWKKK